MTGQGSGDRVEAGGPAARPALRRPIGIEAESILTQPPVVIAARAAVMSLVTALALMADAGGAGFRVSLGFLAVLGATYLMTAAALWRGRQGHWRTILLSGFVLDIPLTTAIVHLTGGIESQFTILYLFLVLTGGMVLAGRVGLILGGASAGAYALLLAAERLGFLAPVGFGGATARAVRLDDGSDLARIALYLVVLPAMGVLAGAAGRLLGDRVRALETMHRDLTRARLDTAFVLSQLGSGLLSLDDDGRILHFNRAAGEILDLAPEHVVGEPLSAIAPGAEAFVTWIEQARRGGAALTRQMVEITTQEGSLRPIGMTGSRVGRSGLVIVFQDLTAARREEAERVRQEKLATIGGLVAGVTHEIRNGIKPIAGSLYVLLAEPALKGPNRRLVEIAARECSRITSFVQSLLDYGRVTALVLEEVDLESLLQEVGELVQLAGEEKIAVKVVVFPAASGITALVDREPMKQVLVNLTRNALDAMGEAGGELRIELEHEDALAAPAAVIRIADSGPGIPPELVPRIFEPFFTTKPGGTGFGLAIAAGIVERHGGTLGLGRPRPGSTGAVFEIRLPERASLAHLDLTSAAA
jgi:two-component system sensor histidine kinase PilS (NtrC family)